MSTSGRGRGNDEDESPLAPPIPSFASLRAPRRTHAALDVLLPPAADEPPVAEQPPSPQEDAAAPGPGPAGRPAPPAGPRPAEWPDLWRFGVRVATAALCLPGLLVREPARRLRRLLGE